MVLALRNALSAEGHRASPFVSSSMLGAFRPDGIESRELLVLNIMDISNADRARILEFANQLESLQLVIEPFGPGRSASGRLLPF